ncbi:MAG: 30S ribosomal protein S9 [Clostridia bacterium]|nr:30S ribosomal protein S9 [Clostridia bacterium]
MAEAKATKKAAAPKKAPAKKAKAVVEFSATGRRKQSIARVRLTPSTKGSVTINGKHIDEYLALGTLKLVAMQALELVGATEKYDVVVNVHGGGLTGQAGAIRHGIARALVKADETYKAELKKAGFLTRDQRSKERKKYGLKKARKAPQFRKR